MELTVGQQEQNLIRIHDDDPQKYLASTYIYIYVHDS